MCNSRFKCGVGGNWRDKGGLKVVLSGRCEALH